MGEPVARRQPGYAWLRLVAVFLLSLAFLHHLQFRTEFIVGYDGFFHIKYAELLRSEGILHEFKWAARSVWATAFSDKELLYHLFLVPFTYLADLATGLKIATVLLGAGVLTSFYQILRLHDVRFPFLWYVLLCSSGLYFLYRVAAPRPQVLAIGLFLWALHFTLADRRIPLAIVCFIYSLSYTAFHLPLAVALLIALHLLAVERRIEWKTPATILGALAAGVLLNPYFPTNLRYFYIQNIYVPFQASVGHDDMQMATELLPMTTRQMVESLAAVAAPLALAFLVSLVRPMRLDLKTRHLFLISLALLFLTMEMQRFAEYSVPVALFFTACFFTAHLRDFTWTPSEWSGAKSMGVAAVVACVGLLAWHSYREVAPYFDVSEPAYKEAALYLRQRTEPDEIIFTCDWDSTPQLLYYNDRNRYLVLLDPSFMRYRDEEYWRRWSNLANGRAGPFTYPLLAEEFRYGVCSTWFEELREIVEKDPRMEIVLENEEMYVFRIREGNQPISLDDLEAMSS